MPQRLDPYSEGFLRTCFKHAVPEPIAHQMLVKAAASNARQPGVQLPIGVIGQLALFEAGKRVSELAREGDEEKQASAIYGGLQTYPQGAAITGVAPTPPLAKPPLDLTATDARKLDHPAFAGEYKKLWRAAQEPGHVPAFFKNIMALKQRIGRDISNTDMKRDGGKDLPTKAQMTASTLPRTA